jgi:NADPH:quinone reductase-like Zn-dependent oxidoreductase
MANYAAWIKEKHATLTVGAADTPKPGEGELLIKNEVIGFSPIESKVQRYISSPHLLTPL